MELPPIASRQLSRLQNMQVVQRYKDHIPKLSPMHYASAMVLVLILLFNTPIRNSSSVLRTAEHCINLDIAIEATAASMRHASSQKYPKGLCQRVPLHQSAPWLWNAHAQQILDATYDPVRDGSSDWLVDAFRVLQPMALSTRGKPQHEVWGHFINKIELKLSEAELLHATEPIKILVIGGHYDAASSCSTKGQSAPNALNCDWVTRLQRLMDYHFGEAVIQLSFQSVEHATTNLMTHALKTNQLGAHDADLIIYAMTSQELHQDSLLTELNLERPIDLDARMSYYQRLLFRVQDFVRASLESQPCKEHPPPIILVDDYVGGLHDKVLLEESMTRALQQVADHHQVAYVSLPRLVRKLVLTDTKNNPWTPDWSDGKNIQHGRTAHVAILWALLYNLLEYTIDYCSHESDISEYRKVQMETKLVEDWVFDRVNQQPPYLNGDLLWTQVTSRWKESVNENEARKRHVCVGKERQSKARQCALAMWGRNLQGEFMTASAIHSLLKPHIVRNSGFTILDGGILRAVQPRAVLELVISDENIDVDLVSLFLGPGDVKVLQDPINQLENAELKLTISAGEANATAITTLNVVDRMSWEQEIPDNEPGQGIHLMLELVAGATVDIVGLFLCTGDEIAFYGGDTWSERVI